MPAANFLTAEHPIYTANALEWARNERRLRGGVDVRAELKRFDFEEAKTAHYEARQLMATYLNFPDIHATTTLGHMMAKAPAIGAGLSLGTLGEVGPRGRFTGSLGERLYYNVDGVGNDGSQWDNWWLSESRYSMATGFRWIFVDHPNEAPVTLARQLAGFHPYLVGFSPVDVPFWHFSRGRLNCAIVLLNEERPRIEGGAVTGMGADGHDYLFLCRRGFTAFDESGSPYSVGGWFRFDKEHRLQDFGTWGMTNGEIPLFPLFYERMRSARGAGHQGTGAGTELAANLGVGSTTGPLRHIGPSLSIARSGLQELGNLAVSYMNLDSAADFDTWDAAMSLKYVLGADPDGWAMMTKWLEQGSRVVPIPTNTMTEQIPQILDGSQGAVTAEVFQMRLQQKIENARQLSIHEASSTPDSSGVSKEAGFGEFKAPRLVLQAGELEQAQNTALHFLEMRAGARTPTGGVSWTRDFELEPVADAIEAAFAVEKLAGLNSRDFKAELMVQYLKRKGLITDDAKGQEVKKEYVASIEAAEKAAEDMAAGLGAIGGA